MRYDLTRHDFLIVLRFPMGVRRVGVDIGFVQDEFVRVGFRLKNGIGDVAWLTFGFFRQLRKHSQNTGRLRSLDFPFHDNFPFHGMEEVRSAFEFAKASKMQSRAKEPYGDGNWIDGRVVMLFL